MKRFVSRITISIALVVLVFSFPAQGLAQGNNPDKHNDLPTGFPAVPDRSGYENGIRNDESIDPKVPVVLDGVKIDPETFAKYYSRADLRFVYNPFEQDVLYAFSTAEGLKSFGEELQKKIDAQPSQEIALSSKTQTYLYDRYNYGTPRYDADCNAAASLPGFNDTTSSLSNLNNATCASGFKTYFVGYVGAFWTGASICVPPNVSLPDLSLYGFDNNISSIDFVYACGGWR